MSYEVIVVGSRVAGSVVAALPGQQGHNVLVLDRARFPSDTLSTHFFRAPALRVFERLEVLNQVKASAPPLTVLWNYIDGHVVSDAVEAEEPHLRFFLCERRITLDGILFKRAASQRGVEARENALVTELIWSDGRAVGARWREHDQQREAMGRVVIGADGFYSTIARIVRPAVEASSPVQRCMYYAYFQNLERMDVGPAAEHHFVGDTLSYVFPTDAGLTLAAVSMPIREFGSFKQDPVGRLRSHLASLPLLAPRLSRADLAGEVKGAGNIPCYQRVPYGPGWALVGDAHQIMDPWSGMGIDHAVTHSALLADELGGYLRGEATWETAMSAYHSKARAWSEKTYRRTCSFAADLRPMTRAALQRRGLSF